MIGRRGIERFLGNLDASQQEAFRVALEWAEEEEISVEDLVAMMPEVASRRS